MIYSFNIRIINVPSGQPVTAAAPPIVSIGAGSFLGGVVAGVVAALLVVGIMHGCWKLNNSNSGNGSNVDTKKEK